MTGKFSELLAKGSTWKIEHNNAVYNSRNIAKIINSIDSQIRNKVDSLDGEGYLVAIGFNSLEYFIYTLYASAFGLRLLLINPKMIDVMLTHYNLKISAIISSRKISRPNITCLKIALFEKNSEVCEDFAYCSEFAKIGFLTSGTTSVPKIILYREDKLFRNAHMVGGYFNLKKDDRCLCFFLFNYMYGFSMLMATLLYSGAVILERPTITPQEIAAYLLKKKITMLPIISPIIRSLLEYLEKNEKKEFFDCLTIVNASDKIYQQDVEGILKIAPVFWNNFGQTESGPRIFCQKITSENLSNIHRFSYEGVIALGKPAHPSISVFVKNSGKLCAPNEVGELSYVTPFAMEGYLDATGTVRPSGAEQSSGDLVFRDDQGTIFWVGRKNQTLKIKGKFVNISLLHSYFDQMSEIRKSYFVVDNEQHVFGFFILEDKGTDNASLRSKILSSYNAHFQLYPRIDDILFIDELPMTESGKIKVSTLTSFTRDASRRLKRDKVKALKDQSIAC